MGYLADDGLYGSPADDRTIMTLQGVLQRGQLAYHNGGLFLGAVLGLFVGALPPFVRTQNRDSFQLFYTSIAQSQMTFLKSIGPASRRFNTSQPRTKFGLPFEDPPFNQRQKIMGWFSPTLVTTVKAPRKQDNIYMDEYRPPKNQKQLVNPTFPQHLQSIDHEMDWSCK